MPLSTFETRSRFCFLQSRSSRREREFVHLISGFETRSRLLFTLSQASKQLRDEFEIFQWKFLYLSCQLSLLSNLSHCARIENSLSRSRMKVKVVSWCGKLCCWICEWTAYMPYGGGRNNIDALKKIWIIISLFSRQDRDFYYLVVRNEVKICFFYISCFETRSRISSIKSRISRRGREIKNTENQYTIYALD